MLVIAYGLVTTIPLLRRIIDQKIANDRSILEASLEDQFRELIVIPLLKRGWWRRAQERLLPQSILKYPNLVIIDGLDECSDVKSQQRVISILMSAYQQHPDFPLRLLICSRPESWIRNAFNDPNIRAFTKHINLDDLNSSSGDIEKYFLQEFVSIRKDAKYSHINFPSTWPSAAEVQCLVQNASGLFIYATAVIEFVKAEFANPVTQLRIILDPFPTSFIEFDGPYRKIVSVEEHQYKFIPKGIDLSAISSATPGSSNSAMGHASPIVNVPPETSPSIVTVGDIRALLSTETAVDTLLTLAAPRVPPILDLLQTEIRGKALDHEYRRKYGKCLRLLVDKYHVLPPSLFADEVTMGDQHPLAVGAYSDIYRGAFRNQPVCLKVLRMHIHKDEERTNKQLREFYKEALLWTQLNHPNLLSFLGVNIALFPRRLCLVSPWMVNGEITSYLESHPSHNKLRAISDIAAGISYLHSHNIVHGDIKGANILVDEDGRCYLADFGLAVATMTTTLLSSTTNTSGKGTMRWMAPELFRDSSNDAEDTPTENDLKLAIDIYAYACTIYEVITGKLPFAHLSDPQVMFTAVRRT